MRYSQIITNKNKTPQTQQMFMESTQVVNDAGGYIYSVDNNVLLERFLLLGTEGGTYYVGESKLTKDNATNVIKMIQENGISVVSKTVEFFKANRSPKSDACIFVLALATTYGNQPTKNAVYAVIPTLFRTATQFFMFVANVNELRGWSRGLRNAVAKWYTSMETNKLAYQLIKYRNREGLFIDHINGNPLDNRRENLRIVTHKQNTANRGKRISKSTSKFLGVFKKKDKSKFQSAISINGKSVHIGYFKTELEAAKAYNIKAKEIFGEFARLNIF